MKHLAGLSQSLESGTRAKEFATIAKMIAASKGDAGHAAQMSRARGGSPRVWEILQKASVDVGMLSDSDTWGSELGQVLSQLSSAFVESLRHSSAFDAIAAAGGFRPVPLRTRISVTTLGASGAEVAEAFSKPISRLELTGSTLEVRKAAAICVLSDELARSATPAALELVGRELRGAVGNATDAAFIAELVATDSSPQASGGDDAADGLADLSAAMARCTGSAQSRWFGIVGAATAKAYAFFGDHAFRNMTPSGGSLGGVPILVTDALPAGVKIVVLDANQVAADVGKVTLDGASHATLSLSDDSTEGPQTLTSLWQRGLKAVRCERVHGWQILRDTAVAVVEDASA